MLKNINGEILLYQKTASAANNMYSNGTSFLTGPLIMIIVFYFGCVLIKVGKFYETFPLTLVIYISITTDFHKLKCIYYTQNISKLCKMRRKNDMFVCV